MLNYSDIDMTTISLILMNDTFPDITYFSKLLYHNPLPEGLVLKCALVKHSLFDRDIKKPIIEPIKPMIYYIEAILNFSSCLP